MPRELIRPMLAVPGQLPSGPDWAFELKWDGVRAVVYNEGGELAAFSRNDRDISVSYPELSALAAALIGIDAVVDGELVALDPTTGRPSFGTLQSRMHVADPSAAARLASQIPVSFVAFDLLRLSGESLLKLPYSDRRELLEHLDLNADHVQTAPVFDGPGADVFQVSLAQGMEGVIAKRRDSRYEPGRRSQSWIKVKHIQDQEVLIGGWHPGAGRRAGRVGALLLGVPRPSGLRYVGQVGTGFTEAQLDALGRLFAVRARPSSPFDAVLPSAVTRNAQWIEPDLVGEVAYSEWTSDAILRHPSWRGLRPDKSPADIVGPDAI